MASQMILWIILGLLVLFGIALVVLWRKNSYKTDYYNLFIIGILWFAIGLPMGNNLLWMLGLVFMFAGLAHKKEWKENRRTWKKLSDKERKTRIVITIILGILVLVGLVLFLLPMLTRH
ncbi:hypothetical protein JW707_03420 [Candidatus Woesearchaeota archaeon]|nr:hypothetical protein [Candidatus Woesearchaeota archaeon]